MDLHLGMGSSGNACGSPDSAPGCDSPTMAALHKFLPSNNEDAWSAEHLYACDEFRMFEFKVRRCMRGRSHDWTECPFAHPGEKARRRDPRRFHYAGTSCPDFRKGGCKNGDACDLAHGVFECWLHPARYRTQPCKDGRNCKRKVCFFAHTPQQLRVAAAAAAVSPPLSPRGDTSPPLSPCSAPRDAALLKSLAHALLPPPAARQHHLLERIKSMPHAGTVEADRRSRMLAQSLSFNSSPRAGVNSLVAALQRQIELGDGGYPAPSGGYLSPSSSSSYSTSPPVSPFARSPLFRSNDCARSLSPSSPLGSPSIWSRNALDDEYYAQRLDQASRKDLKNLPECGDCPDLGWVNELVAIN